LLDRLGVLSGQQWADEVSDAGGVAVSCAADVPCAPVPTTVTARTVTAELVVDGVRLPAVGWSVTIGEHDQVESVSGTWAEPQDVDRYPLRSTQQVFDDLRAGNARFAGPQPLAAAGAAIASPTGDPEPSVVEVHVSGVSLGLARWDGTDNAEPVTYLLPTYRFHAHVGDGAPYDIEVLALDPTSFTVAGPVSTGGAEPGPPATLVERAPATGR
jgi:hypothetical protein